MRIGCDIDGVLADFNGSFINRCIRVTGKDLFPPRPFDIPTWDYPQTYGYTEDETSAVWKDIKADATFWKTLLPYVTTKAALHYLTKQVVAGNDVYFVTSRPGVQAKSQTEHWLMKHGFLHIPTVLISSEKGECCHALQLDVYIDDRWENCVDVTQKSNAQVFMLKQPWNQHKGDPGTFGIIVTHDVVGIAGHV